MGLITNLWLSATPLSPQRYLEVKHAVHLLGAIAGGAFVGVVWVTVLLIRARLRKPSEK